MNAINDHTIVALATPQGVGAIAVIRLSGKEALEITNRLFSAKDLTQQKTHTLHVGKLEQNGQVLDEVVISLFREPKSFTKENVVEISCHGSQYIVKQIIQALLQEGAKLAGPGEFTKRAFMNGRFDLAQAEAVADLIAADSEASHKAALQQMRGGFSEQIQNLRGELVHFASMIELELDFGEEDVEFASRDDLKRLVNEILQVVNNLIQSFDLGNVIKNGVPTVIVGKPNAGKSTLLNALLNEEKAIVSDIPGTTRDFIEDEIYLGGVSFRFIDTAGLRETTDKIESMGVERTQAKMKEASLIVYIFDLVEDNITDITRTFNMLENQGIPFVKVANKIDQGDSELLQKLEGFEDIVYISAEKHQNLDALKQKFQDMVNLDDFRTGSTVVTNLRHYENLMQTRNSLQDVLTGIDNEITNDFLAQDLKHALNHLGEITGEITSDDLLANIFSKFCIGK